MLDAAHRQTIVEALIPVTFHKLPTGDTADLARRLTRPFPCARYRAGMKIIKKGEVGDTFYIVDKGQVTVSVED
eukprot:2012909-Pyramimonas_sp.AAC.1